VARLLVVRASGHASDSQRRYPRWELTNNDLRRLLQGGVGGVILLGGSAQELALRCRQLQAWAGEPLLLCADVEEGVGQRFEGASWLVPPLAIGRLLQPQPPGSEAASAAPSTGPRAAAEAPAEPVPSAPAEPGAQGLDPEPQGRPPAAAAPSPNPEALAERYGRCTGRQARLLGLNWVLGPVCDVNNNPANPVINVRAWGEDPATASRLAAAFLRGAQAEGVLCCAKHFPGHGDTASDSHLELPLLGHSRERLEAVELPPFRAAIAAGVASVMTAHLLLEALDGERPATLAPAVLDGLLRRDLGFEGLVVTDALVMEAITAHHGPGEAALLAFTAGADLILMPADADAAIDALVAAIDSGAIPRQRLEASLQRRERALAAVAPAGAEPADSAEIDPAWGGRSGDPNGSLVSPAEADLARELVELSLEVRGPARESTPSTPSSPPAPLAPGPGLNLIRLDNSLACPFLPAMAPALVRPAGAGYQSCLIDSRSPSPWSGDPQAPLALERLPGGPVLLQLFVRGNPFRGSAGGEEPWPAVVTQLLATGRLAALAVYGSPYLWESLRPLLPAALPAAYSPGQMPLAQALLLDRLGLAAAALEGGFTD
jgi:beta-glucosidase